MWFRNSVTVFRNVCDFPRNVRRNIGHFVNEEPKTSNLEVLSSLLSEGESGNPGCLSV